MPGASPYWCFRSVRKSPLPSRVVVLRRQPGQQGADGGDVDELRRALAGQRQVPLAVSRQSRLYLLGAGQAVERTLAGWPPAALAAVLAGAGLQELALISIVSDGAGRDTDRDNAAQIDGQATSFASLLHRALREVHGIVTTVYARVGAVRVSLGATPVNSVPVAAGRKLTASLGCGAAGEHHAPHSKLHLRWHGEHQVREWRYSPGTSFRLRV